MSAEAIIQADVLSEFVGNALAVVNEAKIHTNEDGFELRAVDPANVCMVDESLAAHAFESYEFGGGVIGVNLKRLNDILGVAGGELVHLRLDEETGKLEVESGGMEISIALIDPDSIRAEPEIPGVLDKLTARLVIEAGELQRARKAADLCSEHIAFACDGETWSAEAEGDTDDVRVEWSDKDVGEQSEAGEAESLFSLDYVGAILGPIASGTEVVLHYGDSFPLFLDSEFADGDGDLRFMVAPRIESDGGEVVR